MGSTKNKLQRFGKDMWSQHSKCLKSFENLINRPCLARKKYCRFWPNFHIQWSYLARRYDHPIPFFVPSLLETNRTAPKWHQLKCHEMSSIVPTAWNDTINHLLVDSYVVLCVLGGSRDNFTFATTFAELSQKKQSETHTNHMANVCFVARSEAEQMFEQTKTYSNTIFAGFLLNRQLRGPLYQVPYNLIDVLLHITFYSFLFY